jgi:TolB protein
VSALLCIVAAAVLAAPSYAFLAPVHDVWQVWVSMDGARPQPLTGDPQDKISLSASEGGPGLLAVTRAGEAVLLHPSGDVFERFDLGGGSGDAALAPDGSRVVFTREEKVNGVRTRRLWLFDRASRRTRPLPPRPGMQHAPAWGPDGASLAYTATGQDGGEDLWLVRIDGSDERQLTTGRDRYLEPSIAPDGSIYVSSDRGGDYDIWRVDPKDESVRPVIARKGFDGRPSVSADGRLILFVSSAGGRRSVWSAGVDGSAPRALSEPQSDVRDPVWLASVEERAAGDRAVGQPAGARAPAATGEGRIAFLRETGGTWQPWSVKPDGSGLKQLATLPTDVSRITLSGDGATLLADASDGGLYVVATADGTSKRLTVDPGGPTDAALSADGRRIVYSVNTLGGVDSNDLWLVGIDGGRAKKLTDEPYLQHFPVWSPDGSILYLSGNGGQSHDIRRFDPAKRSTARVLGGRLYNFEPAVSAAGDIAFSSNREDNYEIWLLPAGASEPKRLTRESAYDGQPTFSPDGSKIAFVSRRGGAGRIWILDVSTGATTPLAVDGVVRLPFWYEGPAPATVAKSPAEGR